MKEILGIIAIIITFYMFYPYIRSILRGETKPHVFSWVIWGITTFIVFLAQMSDGGGTGAWPIGVSGLITFYVAWLAYVKRADCHITRLDWIFFITALSSIPLWYFTNDALWAVVILTTIDVIGFAPTFRKSYHKPFDERLDMYTLSALRNVISVIALENYSLITVLCPAVTAVPCVMMAGLIIWRRKILKP